MCRRPNDLLENLGKGGIILLGVVWKIHAVILVKRARTITEGMVGEEQGTFRVDKGCIDQILH